MTATRATAMGIVLLAAIAAAVAAVAGAAEPANEQSGASMNVVRYEDFGAKGDGKTDDTDAIARAHAHANERGLPVRADDDATYYIGGGQNTVVIQTDTDFGAARFVIDDTDVENRRAHVFEVRSSLAAIKPAGVTSLTRRQAKIDADLPRACVVVVTNAHVKRFIRRGGNQNKGSSQTDAFVVDADGNVDPNTAIIWDFDRVTDIVAYPIDERTLTIRGGRFTTIANRAESKYTYYARGFAIRRSNVVVDGLEHRVTGEGDHGAPYGGFISISRCAKVTVENAVLTGHKTYRTIGSAGRPVSMGTYDINANRALNVRFVNCTQTNDIMDRRYWGIMGSNFCKNLVYDRCKLSRFDAHQGVFNATIRGSTLGHAGVNLIGSGTFVMEDSTVNGGSMLNLRPDYGSTWDGEWFVRNCTFVPGGGRPITGRLVSGSNDGQHDFGYACRMPERITLENLRIDDSKHPADYPGPAIFGNFNRRYTTDDYAEQFPYTKPKRVVLKNVTTASGRPLRLSDNPVMFRGVEVITDPSE